MPSPSYNVLLVDDSEDDRLFMLKALERYGGFRVVGEASDGAEAISYLCGEGPFANRTKHPFPDAIFLDLKMPSVSGYDVLQWLQGQSFPRMIAVIISGSYLTEDINRCHALGAHGYFKKTAFPDEQIALITEIEKLLKKRSASS
jgi:CheY-like chemotaxis protein